MPGSCRVTEFAPFLSFSSSELYMSSGEKFTRVRNRSCDVSNAGVCFWRSTIQLSTRLNPASSRNTALHFRNPATCVGVHFTRLFEAVALQVENGDAPAGFQQARGGVDGVLWMQRMVQALAEKGEVERAFVDGRSFEIAEEARHSRFADAVFTRQLRSELDRIFAELSTAITRSARCAAAARSVPSPAQFEIAGIIIRAASSCSRGFHRVLSTIVLERSCSRAEFPRQLVEITAHACHAAYSSTSCERALRIAFGSLREFHCGGGAMSRSTSWRSFGRYKTILAPASGLRPVRPA